MFPDSSRHNAHGVGGAKGSEGAHHRYTGGRAREGDDIGLEQFLNQLAFGPRVHRRGQRVRQLGASRGMLQLSHGGEHSRNLRVTYMQSDNLRGK